jgi:hypothetical protein
MDENPPPKKSWLQTLPGMLTAVAGSLVALATIAGTLTPLAGKVTAFFWPDQPKGCHTQAGYPVGRWEVASINSDTRKSEFSTFITFLDPQNGTWIPSQGTGSFTASITPKPHSGVILTLKPDIQSTYVSTSKLVVSGDGCRMAGTFADNQNHSGEVAYVYVGDGSSPRKQ